MIGIGLELLLLLLDVHILLSARSKLSLWYLLQQIVSLLIMVQ